VNQPTAPEQATPVQDGVDPAGGEALFPRASTPSVTTAPTGSSASCGPSRRSSVSPASPRASCLPTTVLAAPTSPGQLPDTGIGRHDERAAPFARQVRRGRQGRTRLQAARIAAGREHATLGEARSARAPLAREGSSQSARRFAFIAPHAADPSGPVGRNLRYVPSAPLRSWLRSVEPSRTPASSPSLHNLARSSGGRPGGPDSWSTRRERCWTSTAARRWPSEPGAAPKPERDERRAREQRLPICVVAIGGPR